eukprot:3632384-Rhodomonas_salina.1
MPSLTPLPSRHHRLVVSSPLSVEILLLRVDRVDLGDVLREFALEMLSFAHPRVPLVLLDSLTKHVVIPLAPRERERERERES